MAQNKNNKYSHVDMPSKDDLEKVLLTPYSDEELEMTPELQQKIEDLVKFFDQSGINYEKFPISGDKKAYPNNDQYMYMPGQHNTQKWLQAVKDLFYKERNGMNRVSSIRQVTNDWNLMETHDFLNWLRYYEEGAHMKYKFAQVWYENGAPGYFLHVKKDVEPEESPKVNGRDIDSARDEAASEMSNAEKKQIIEKQRNKIIGRLDSAEKLLRSQDGQIFAGKEYEALMEIIYQLKKKIQLVNKISSSTKLYEDMIVRQANMLARDGFIKSSNLLYSIADGGAVALPVPASPAPPAQSSGAPGGLPSMGPGMAQTPPESAPNETSAVPEGISEFLENLETGNLTTEDELEVLDVEDDLNVEDSEEQLVVEAQDIPSTPIIPPTTTIPKKTAPLPPLPKKEDEEDPLEVTEDDLKPKTNNADQEVSNFDSKVDALLSNLSVSDVVAKLEDLSKVFKTREIPRQLAIVDMMLDSLGLASYFPGLSEAQNKALESNNYISTRVEDILSKLRGSIVSKDIDLKGGDKEENPAVSGIKEKLQQSEDKEKARKQMRKDQESEDLEGKNITKKTPDIEVEKDLEAPLPPAPKPTPVKPPTNPLNV